MCLGIVLIVGVRQEAAGENLLDRALLGAQVQRRPVFARATARPSRSQAGDQHLQEPLFLGLRLRNECAALGHAHPFVGLWRLPREHGRAAGVEQLGEGGQHTVVRRQAPVALLDVVHRHPPPAWIHQTGERVRQPCRRRTLSRRILRATQSSRGHRGRSASDASYRRPAASGPDRRRRRAPRDAPARL